VGSYAGEVVISDATSLQTHITIPKGAHAGQTIYLILEATDNGAPALTSYQRVIVTVRE
jgi:cellulose-binding protein